MVEVVNLPFFNRFELVLSETVMFSVVHLCAAGLRLLFSVMDMFSVNFVQTLCLVIIFIACFDSRI